MFYTLTVACAKRIIALNKYGAFTERTRCVHGVCSVEIAFCFSLSIVY